jgi:hypothetical protein
VGKETETPQTNRPLPTEASTKDPDRFQERKRKKRNVTGEKSPPKLQPAISVPTPNFFAPLNSGDMETEDRMGDKGRKETPKGTGWPPPITVTTNINLIKVQNEI